MPQAAALQNPKPNNHWYNVSHPRPSAKSAIKNPESPFNRSVIPGAMANVSSRLRRRVSWENFPVMRKLLLTATVLLLPAGVSAGIDPKNFDLAAKPSDDFYQYADGSWIKNNPVPA